MSISDLHHELRPAHTDPAGALVLLHGRATSEFDLLPLMDELDPERRLTCIAPRAPLSLPPGGAHWYVVREIGFPDPDTFLATFERLAAWFDALPDATGVPLERTVVGGFSQGAVMSYAVAFASGRQRPAGIVALSGFIPTVEGFTLDLADLKAFPAALGHGSHDPVIGVDFGRSAASTLTAAGAAVTWRESPIGHSVDPLYLSELGTWLRQVLPDL
ncbi:MAG: alpha/beta fold hydrolase [Thermoleophilaceae bacterium]